MTPFESFNLDPALMQHLALMSYTEPTPVQAEAIPLVLDGMDIMGSAQTGTGKTGAFAIPLVHKLLSSTRGSAIVLSPTRELAKQIIDIIQQLLGRNSAIKAALLIGGESMGKQLKQLSGRPRIIVGTPGRVNDHLERGSLLLHDTRFLVLDETDRMLDMGFSVQLDRIVHYLPEKRQTLMFSATLPPAIVRLSAKYMHNPKRIAIGSTTEPIKAIKQTVIELSADKKLDTLIEILHKCSGSVIIFVKTKFGADKMAVRLRKAKFEARAIHGNLNQNKRDRVLRDFRDKRFQILVATDVAARGLDVPHIEHVINYDLPQVSEDYIHRIGRTARAGAEGEAINLIAPQDRKLWQAIQHMMDPSSRPPRGNGPRNAKRGGRSGGSSSDRRNRDGKRRFGSGSKSSDEKRAYAGKKRSSSSDGSSEDRRDSTTRRHSGASAASSEDRRDNANKRRPGASDDRRDSRSRRRPGASSGSSADKRDQSGKRHQKSRSSQPSEGRRQNARPQRRSQDDRK